MIFNFTHFLNYSEIKVGEIDIYEDAFGLYPEISEVHQLPARNEFEPGQGLVNRLIRKIRKNE